MLVMVGLGYTSKRLCNGSMLLALVGLMTGWLVSCQMKYGQIVLFKNLHRSKQLADCILVTGHHSNGVMVLLTESCVFISTSCRNVIFPPRYTVQLWPIRFTLVNLKEFLQ